jgi:hypothetical protein
MGLDARFVGMSAQQLPFDMLGGTPAARAPCRRRTRSGERCAACAGADQVDAVGEDLERHRQVATASVIGGSFGRVGVERGGPHPVDAHLDLVLEHGTDPRWRTTIFSHRPEILEKMARSPGVQMGFSDAAVVDHADGDRQLGSRSRDAALSARVARRRWPPRGMRRFIMGSWVLGEPSAPSATPRTARSPRR